jgi:hypothetical protein
VLFQEVQPDPALTVIEPIHSRRPKEFACEAWCAWELQTFNANPNLNCQVRTKTQTKTRHLQWQFLQVSEQPSYFYFSQSKNKSITQKVSSPAKETAA